MGYIDNNLMVGEQVVYRTTLHWAIFLIPSVLFAATLVFLFVAFLMLGKIWTFVALGLMVICGLVLLGRYATFATSEFGVTNKRVVTKVGVLSTRSIELLLGKVETVQIEQDLLGRVFGYGTIIITGTGGTQEPLGLVAAPFEFRNRVQEQVAASQ